MGRAATTAPARSSMCRSGAGTCPCPNQMVNGNFTFNFPNGSSLLFGADGARLPLARYPPPPVHPATTPASCTDPHARASLYRRLPPVLTGARTSIGTIAVLYSLSVEARCTPHPWDDVLADGSIGSGAIAPEPIEPSASTSAQGVGGQRSRADAAVVPPRGAPARCPASRDPRCPAPPPRRLPRVRDALTPALCRVSELARLPGATSVCYEEALLVTQL